MTDAITRTCRLIEASPATPVPALAREAGMSTAHFQRTFKAVTGVTPKAYALSIRTKRMKTALAQSDTVTSAMYKAGFSSSGRFYDTTPDTLGMTPSAFRTGGRDMHIRFAVGECSLGSILVAATDRGICAITLGDDPDFLARELQSRFRNADITPGDTAFDSWVATVVGFVEHPETGFDLPLDIRGTAFQCRVWQALREIPPGSTASYADIAKRIGHPTATRAVAQACGANHIAVAIPCHRVVRTDGGMSGYRWGVKRKETLLKREKALRGR